MKPILKDDDAGTISVSLDGKILMSWTYGADREDRGEKMRHGWYFCDGFMAGVGAPKISPKKIAKSG